MKRRSFVLLGFGASTVAGCSLVLGLSDDVAISTYDASAVASDDSAPSTPDAPDDSSRETCSLATGWRLDCTFGGPLGQPLPLAATQPSRLANRETNGYLYMTTPTLDAGANIGLIDAAGTYESAIELGQNPATTFVSAATSFQGANVVSLISSQPEDGARDENIYFAGMVAAASVSTRPPTDFGECLLDAGGTPQEIGFVFPQDGGGFATSVVNLFVMANKVLDGGMTRPVLLDFSGYPLSSDPLQLTEVFASDDDGSAPLQVSPVTVFTCGSQIPPQLGADPLAFSAVMAGTSKNGSAPVAELFIDASTANPPRRVALPFVATSAFQTNLFPGSVFFFGVSDGHPAEATLVVGDEAETILPVVPLNVSSSSFVGTYQTALTSDAVTAVAATMDTLFFFQWSIGAGQDAGVPSVSPSSSFGVDGVLHVPIGEPFDLGNIASFGDDFYVSIRLRNTGEDRLLRITNR